MTRFNLTIHKAVLMMFMTIFTATASTRLLANEGGDLSTKKDSLAHPKDSKIQVLNFGTFHFGATSDAHKAKFDEHDQTNQQAAKEIAEMLAEFKPTVILVERVPEYNDQLQEIYQSYVANPDMTFKRPTEVQLLAFELGRLSGTERIYGIDHKMGYNYKIGIEIENAIDPSWHDKFFQDPYQFYPELNFRNDESMSLIDKLRIMNQDQILDYAIVGNADMLTHAGTESGFEGADEAAKYYQRNLRMYSNMNRIQFNEDDRVFILMGSSHTAFFRDFLSRSPKYEMVNTLDYLK